MSLVTRCPACTTTFKVVRDQLRISDGWVRCGRCSHVFDATLDLHEAPDGAPGASGAPSTPANASPAMSGGYMPGLVEPAAQAKAEPPAAPALLPSLPDLALHQPEPPQAAEDADFFDDEPEPEQGPKPEQHVQPETPVQASGSSTAIESPVVAAPPSLEPSSSTSFAFPPSFSLSLPEHGLAADEPWSDLDVSEPAWRPPASSLPPFPNIDLNLAAPPPSPPPPLPVAPRIKASALVERASDDGEGEREQEEKDHDQVQMQKALRRARIKSAKIATAKAREERAAAKASASAVKARSEADFSLSTPFEAPEGHPFAEEDEPAAEEKPPGFWQRKGVRFLLILLAVLAVLLLAVQVIRHERDGIAARQPGLRPALATLCQYTGCELAALRQIGDIVIEGAAFAREKTGGNDYRLSFTLRNGATVQLAMPAVELSLLDTQERAVVRRVLTPVDYGAPAVLAARADRAASLPLTLSATEAAALPPIAGYRVEAFYP